MIGRWALTGFVEDLFAVAVLAGIVTFAIIRLCSGPRREGRDSRFSGSHTGAAWFVLAMIFLVIATLLLYRGAQINTGVFPYAHGAFASQLAGHALAPLGTGVNSVLEAVFILAQLAVVLSFLVFVTYSKHLHIFLAGLNVLFSRRPDGLRALEPMRSDGKALDFEEADPDTDVFGLGKIEDFTWKGLLDMGTCTECGRCQSQCPAWATGKPLSPKMVILDLRDHALAKAPWTLASDDAERDKLPEAVRAEASRPLVGAADQAGVIDPDALWACTNCGACVQECPVDIEHIDHINGMRRHQVLIESAFPVEAAGMLKNLENKGDPWGMGQARRTEWMSELDFEVPVVDGKVPPGTEYLFWVGCAGALEDRARKTTRAIATLLHTAGVKWAVLGPAETCTGDPARRIGNEFLFSMLAQQNIETLNEAGARTIVASCPHCFNAIANEYPQLGGSYEVIHHTQLLSKLVADGRLTPLTPVDEKVTYHDPCFLGRHNKVYSPPRQIMERVPGVQAQEMHRCKERGFCCGAGGARMWMEERIGKRISTERIEEALGTEPDTVSTACPYCLVMLGDAINAKKASGEAKDSLEVVDVAQILARSVRSAEQPDASGEVPATAPRRALRLPGGCEPGPRLPEAGLSIICGWRRVASYRRLLGGLRGNPEQLVEGAAGDPVPDLVAGLGEQAAQGFLGVAVGAFQVRVVIAPQHVAVAGRGHHLDRALVVLEGRVDLLTDDLAGQPAQLGPDEHAVLTIGLVHPVPDGGHPRGAALGDEDAQAGVTVQGTPGHHVRHHPHARIGRLHVVDDGAAGTAEHHRVPAGADVEAEHHPGPLGGGPQRLPPVQRVFLAGTGLAGQEHRLEAQPRDALELGHRVADVRGGHAGGGDDPLVLAQDLGVRPVVPGPHRLPGQLGVGDLDRPESHRGERELAPDALLIEVLQPDLEVPGARRAHRVHEVVQLAVHPLAVDVEDLVLIAPLGARCPLRQPGRKRLQPQVSGFQHV